jgi:CRISPR-associated protein Csm3
MAMALNRGQFQARVTVTADLVAVSGLRIGGSLPGLAIGGVDLPVIRDPVTSYPYIPGSSLRGKMRALLDRWHGNEPNWRVGTVFMHLPDNQQDYDASPVARLFGVMPNDQFTNLRPTRLLVRDVYLDQDEATRLREATRGGLLYTESKMEAAIDRLTSAASPRTIERVLASTIFRPFSASITLYDEDDAGEYLGLLLRGMRLLEDDYLGGHGSRGSGEIAFRDIVVRVRRPEDYTVPFGEGAEAARGGSLFDEALNTEALLDQVSDLAKAG